MYIKNYCRIPTSETSIYLRTFTCVHTYKYIVRRYQGDTHQTAPKSGSNNDGRILTSKIIHITESGVS